MTLQEEGWFAQAIADHLRHDADRDPRDRRDPAVRGLFLQGSDPRIGLQLGPFRALDHWRHHRRADLVLHVPADVHDLPRRVPGRSRARESRARIAAGDDHPAGCARHPGADLRRRRARGPPHRSSGPDGDAASRNVVRRGARHRRRRLSRRRRVDGGGREAARRRRRRPPGCGWRRCATPRR